MAPKVNEEVDLKKRVAEKDLEIATLHDKVKRMEARTELLDALLAQLKINSKQTEDKFKNAIESLSSELKAQHAKKNDLEHALQELTAERARTVEMLSKELAELKSTHKFVTEDLHLQLENAWLQLRDIDDFRVKKGAIEKEVARLKEQLEKEKKEHQNAISDVERTAVQEKEKLRKEMALRIEETKQQILQHMDDQLHIKTKRMIFENEQLAKELSYHIKQSDLLVEKNDNLVQENLDLHRQVLLAKEVEEDLIRRNHMNQKTIRILVYKLQGKMCTTSENNSEEEELKRLVSFQEKLKIDLQEEREKIARLKDFVQERENSRESTGGVEVAMKFLYACVDDLEVEKLAMISEKPTVCWSSSVTDEATSTNLTSFDQLGYEQRREFLLHLLRNAVSLRAVTQNAALLQESGGLRPSAVDSWSKYFRKSKSGRALVSVDDILNLSVEELKLDEPGLKARFNTKPSSVGCQTETMDLEERLAIEMGECLRACIPNAQSYPA